MIGSIIYSTNRSEIGTVVVKIKQKRTSKRVPEIPVIDGFCPMPDIAQLIGGKWKLIILQILIFQGTKRFGELRRLTGNVTQTMMTSQLRALESDGLVTRQVYAEVPPRVEYTATDRALKLRTVFLSLHDWWLSELSK